MKNIKNTQSNHQNINSNNINSTIDTIIQNTLLNIGKYNNTEQLIRRFILRINPILKIKDNFKKTLGSRVVKKYKVISIFENEINSNIDKEVEMFLCHLVKYKNTATKKAESVID